jgi:hypothetical protein
VGSFFGGDAGHFASGCATTEVCMSNQSAICSLKASASDLLPGAVKAGGLTDYGTHRVDAAL